MSNYNNNNNNPSYGRGGYSTGYNNRGRYNSYGRGGRGGFNGNDTNWRAAPLSPLSNFQGQLPDAAVTLDNAAVAYGSAAASPANDSDTNIETKVLPSESAFGNEGANVTSAFSSSSSSDGSANHIVIQAPTPKRPAMAPNFINMSSSAATTPSLVSASTAPAPGPATKNEAVKKETAKDNTVKKETARDNTVQKETAKDEVAKNETKATKHVFDPAFKAVDAAFDVVLDEKILSRLHELDPANAAYLKDNIEKIYAANSGRTASLNKVRDALTADLTNAYGYEQKIDEKLMFHFDRFARKFEESINAPDAESKNALLVEAAKSIQAALRWSDQARIYRKEVDKLSRDVTALDAKLFRDVESSLNNVVGSVKHVLEGFEAKRPIHDTVKKSSNNKDCVKAKLEAKNPVVEKSSVSIKEAHQFTGRSMNERYQEKSTNIDDVLKSMKTTEESLSFTENSDGKGKGAVGEHKG